MGRVIRSKSDYGLMVFADQRYRRADKRQKLPRWVQDYLEPENMALSTDRAIALARDFLRRMGQPYSRVRRVASRCCCCCLLRLVLQCRMTRSGRRFSTRNRSSADSRSSAPDYARLVSSSTACASTCSHTWRSLDRTTISQLLSAVLR